MAEEKLYENKIKIFLSEHGAWFVKYWSGLSSNGKQFTRNGIPDILCCLDGHFVAIEVKAANGRPSELQLHTINEIRKAGGFAFVLYPSGWDKFKQFVKDLKEEKFNREMEVILK